MQNTIKINYLPWALIVVMVLFSASCKKDNGGRLPLPPMDIIIQPNTTIYQELNVVGGWMYLGAEAGVEAPSRGVIVYHASLDEFLAFERTPPFKPDSCCNAAGTVCTALLVGNYFPFVMDTCTDSKYLILDGSPVSGPSNQPLSAYVTEYDGNLLYIHN